jgi:chaperonin GroES
MKKNSFKPLEDRIVVRVAEEEKKSESGIVLSVTTVISDRGEVIAVGPGLLVNGKRIKMSVKPGDIVVLQPNTGKQVKIGAVELLIVRESEVLAVIEK